MNILITAGGTTEPIDSVRKIANSGSGRLSSLIADEFAKREEVERIFYVCSRKSLKPETEKAVIIEIETVQQLADTLSLLLLSERMDVIVHAIAVSDYRVKTVTTAEALLEQLPDKSSEVSEAAFKAALDAAAFDRSAKLSSGLDSVILQLEKTPKVISVLRPLAQKAKIVGFKLLTEVSKEELVNTAYELLKKNDTDFVLANDSSEIRDDAHHAYLVDKSGAVVAEFATKQEIAAGIAAATLGE